MGKDGIQNLSQTDSEEENKDESNIASQRVTFYNRQVKKPNTQKISDVELDELMIKGHEDGKHLSLP